MVRICTLLVIILLAACEGQLPPDKSDLIETDLEFSAYSTEYGMKKAFSDFMHPDCILLRDNGRPLVGAENVNQLFDPMNDSLLILTWEPLDAMISASGDLGFTYGIWTRQLADSVSQGTYTTIWKKDERGDWKWILDTGNDGLGE